MTSFVDLETKVKNHGVTIKKGCDLLSFILQKGVAIQAGKELATGNVRVAVIEGGTSYLSLVASSMYDNKPFHFYLRPRKKWCS